MKLLAVIIIIGTIGLCPSGVSARDCSREEARAAESATDNLNSWADVYAFYKQYGHCIDGGVLEGAEDKIQKLWASQWADLPNMITLIDEDASFRAFLYSVLESEAFPQDVFAVVLRNARCNCPTIAMEFCRAVEEAEKGSNGA